ncbi:hypothetical protein [Nocardia sp. BMG111209]|uniref:hypothetical protein n=1 Tax=Nocardia sp. BMG111209 TaxID=1160137 RepID=UPI00036EDF59|nr:hypothetical protein [Nocardia sp. BMG111209]
MKFDFNEVDIHTTTMNQLVSSMETNAHQIEAIRNELMQEFAGAGATGYEDIMARLKRDNDSYITTLANLKTSIQSVGGTQGLVHSTDTANGNMFLAI